MRDSLLSSRAVVSLGQIQADRSHRFRVAVISTALLAPLVFTTGCSIFHKKQVRVYVPPPVRHPAPPPLKPVDLEAPQLVAELSPDLDLPEPTMVLSPPPAPPPVVRQRPPAAMPPKAAPTPVAPEPPAPKIALILPTEQLRAYNSELDGILERDSKALESVAGKNLGAEQRDRVAQIRELLTQARQTREQDLVTAVNLARRADTLAKDLLNRVP